MWSFILEGVGLTGAYLIGRKYWWAWLILFTNAFLWVIYGLIQKQYGFVVASAFYAPIYMKNTIQWKQKKNSTTQIELHEGP